MRVKLSRAPLWKLYLGQFLDQIERQLKAYCREHALGRLEVKKRGVQIDPEQLRQAVLSDGDREAALIVAPIASQTRVIVTRRVAVLNK